MKKLIKIIQCGITQIKKKIFNSKKTDISHECKELIKINENDNSDEELVNSEEYLENYNVTTRWQTI